MIRSQINKKRFSDPDGKLKRLFILTFLEKREMQFIAYPETVLIFLQTVPSPSVIYMFDIAAVGFSFLLVFQYD